LTPWLPTFLEGQNVLIPFMKIFCIFCLFATITVYFKIFCIIGTCALEFSPNQNIVVAYTLLTEKFIKELQLSHIDTPTVRRWCKMYFKHEHPGPCKLDDADSMEDLFEVLQSSPYYNCLNLGLINHLASLSKISCLICSVENYENTFFDSKLEELFPRELKVYKKGKIASAKVNAKVKVKTIRQLKEFCITIFDGILHLETSVSEPACIRRGCVCITFFIPTDLVDHAFHSASVNTKLFAEVNMSCITIGRYKIEPAKNKFGGLQH